MRLVAPGMAAYAPWEGIKAQAILGDQSFIEKIKPALRDKSTLEEIPKRERLTFCCKR